MNEPVEIFKVLERNSEGTVIHRESFLVDSDYLEKVLESTFPEFKDIIDFLERYTPEEEGMSIYEIATDDGEIQDEASYSLGEDDEDYESLLDSCGDLVDYSDDLFDDADFDDFDTDDDDSDDTDEEAFDIFDEDFNEILEEDSDD